MVDFYIQDNPMVSPVESVIMTFMMSIGELEDVWNALDYTKHTGYYLPFF